MKESCPTLASVFIIGTFTSVLSVQRDGMNYYSATTNPTYLKFHRSPSFGHSFGELTEKSGFSAGNPEENAERYSINGDTSYLTDLGKPNYAFNSRLVLMVSQSVPQHPHIYRSNINYSNKSPIQILPSRFPPPIEKLIQNIQNYFSTYNHPDLQNRPFTPQSPQVSTSTEQAVTTSHPTEPATEISEEITTEDTGESTTEDAEENTVIAVIAD